MKVIGFDLLLLKQKSEILKADNGRARRRVVEKLIEAAKVVTVDWYGLSAPQIGIFYRAFILRDVENRVFTVVINPEILSVSDEVETQPEYCLSVPIIGVHITRPKSVSVRYTNAKGETVERDYDGMLGRAFQHELDHLNGILITDYLVKDDGKNNNVESDS